MALYLRPFECVKRSGILLLRACVFELLLLLFFSTSKLIQTVEMLAIDRSWLLERRAQLRDDSSTSEEAEGGTSNEITTATARLYEYEAGSWETYDLSLPQRTKSLNENTVFKSNFTDEEVLPDRPTLKLYFEWLPLTIQGKLDARPSMSITTLTWRAGRFAYAYTNKYGKRIPEGVSEDLVSVSFYQPRNYY
jgi:hypothetical protein